MKTLSKNEYENAMHDRIFTHELVELGLPSIYFVKIAVNALQTVQHLIPEKHKKVCLETIQAVEKFWCGKMTKKECVEIGEAAQHVAKVSKGTDMEFLIFACGNAATIVSYIENAENAAMVEARYIAFSCVKAAADYVTSLHAGDPNINLSNILKQAIPWNVVCSFQIAKCFGKENDEQFIQEILKDEKLISYTTILLEDENLRKQFQFLMKDYKNGNNIKN